MTLYNGITLFLAAVQTLVSVAMWFRSHTSKTDGPAPQASRRILILMTAIMLGTWMAVAMDFVQKKDTINIIAGWSIVPNGLLPPHYRASVLTGNIQNRKEKYKLMLIARNNFQGIDRLADKEIEKSGLYNIDESLVMMEAVGCGRIRFLAMAENTIEFYAALLPNGVTTQDVNSLLGLKQVGGIIVGRGSQTIQMGTASALSTGQPSAPGAIGTLPESQQQAAIVPACTT